MTDAAGWSVREDRLLGGRVRLLQPVQGYRAATDPVFLAAACPARAGETVLDLGCGAGAAALCLAARVPVRPTGLELQEGYLALARKNAALNGVEMTLHPGDVAAMPGALKALSFDHVILNPPYFREQSLGSPIARKDLAHREAEGLEVWLAAARARLKPRGWLTLIHRAERLDSILAGLTGTGDIAIKPLIARVGRDAKRVLVRARKDVKTPLRLCAPLVLHAGVAHTVDGDDFSPEAGAILRDAAPIAF
ncbi:MAG: methyltransferase domain-containing protein [Pseudomonadota bacterium]